MVKEIIKDDFEDDLYEDYVLYTFKKESHVQKRIYISPMNY